MKYSAVLRHRISIATRITVPVVFVALIGVIVWRPSLVLRGPLIPPALVRTGFTADLDEEDWDLMAFLPPEEREGRVLGAQVKPEPQKIARVLPAAPDGGRQFVESFSTPCTLEETGTMSESKNTHWWVNSGARLLFSGVTGWTIQGRLPLLDWWRLIYAVSNPTDTDNGRLPQNIFRLVQRNGWVNFTQEAYFKIANINLTKSAQRNASNGVLLFNRYLSGDTLYYTGLRVDGAVVIKKKINGVYYTMAYKRFFPGKNYHKDKTPNLIPLHRWIGVRSVVRTNADRTVMIQVYVDDGKTGKWKLALEARDNGKQYGGAAISNKGYAGIRTDFMDVEFEDYKITSL